MWTAKNCSKIFSVTGRATRTVKRLFNHFFGTRAMRTVHDRSKMFLVGPCGQICKKNTEGNSMNLVSYHDARLCCCNCQALELVTQRPSFPADCMLRSSCPLLGTSIGDAWTQANGFLQTAGSAQGLGFRIDCLSSWERNTNRLLAYCHFS